MLYIILKLKCNATIVIKSLPTQTTLNLYFTPLMLHQKSNQNWLSVFGMKASQRNPLIVMCTSHLQYLRGLKM